MTDHARLSDPISSEVAVHAITKNLGLAEQIMLAANRLHPAEFDDTDLLDLVESQTGRRQQRNVIARARGRLEKLDDLVRVGIRQRQDRATVHFRLPRYTDTLDVLDEILERANDFDDAERQGNA